MALPADPETFRHLFRTTEHLVPENDTLTPNELFYTFSSLDLDEFESYLKTLPNSRASITKMTNNRNSMLFARKSQISLPIAPKKPINQSDISKLFFSKPKFGLDLRTHRDIANRNTYIRFPNLKPVNIPLNTRKRSFSEHLTPLKHQNQAEIQPFFKVKPMKIGDFCLKYEKIAENIGKIAENQDKIAENKAKIDENQTKKTVFPDENEAIALLMHYTSSLKQLLKPSTLEFSAGLEPQHERGLFEFIGTLKPLKAAKTSQKPLNKAEIAKIVVEYAEKQLKNYEKLLKKARKSEKNKENKEKRLFSNEIRLERGYTREKLLKEDLFLLNLMRKMAIKGLEIAPLELEELDRLIYSRKQGLLRLISYFSLTLSPCLIPSCYKSSEKADFSMIIREKDEGKSFFDQEKEENKPKTSEKTKKNEEKREKHEKKGLFPFLRSKKTYKSPFSEPFSETIPCDPLESSSLSELKTLEGLLEGIKVEIRPKTPEKHEKSPKTTEKPLQRRFSLRKTVSFEEIASFSDVSAVFSAKRGDSFDKIAFSSRKSLISMQKDSIRQQRDGNEAERGRGISWGGFLKDSMGFTADKGLERPRNQCFNDPGYQERIERIEYLLREFIERRKQSKIMKNMRFSDENKAFPDENKAFSDENKAFSHENKAFPQENRQIKWKKQHPESLLRSILAKKPLKHQENARFGSFSHDPDPSPRISLLQTQKQALSADSFTSRSDKTPKKHPFQPFSSKKHAKTTISATFKPKIEKAAAKKDLKSPISPKKEGLVRFRPPRRPNSKPISPKSPQKSLKKTKKTPLKPVLVSNMLEMGVPERKFSKNLEDQAALNPTEELSLQDYLENEVFTEYPEFFQELMNHEDTHLNVETMQKLRKWAQNRKRRSVSFGELLPDSKRGSFQGIEENREAIKLLKSLRANLKPEKSKRRLLEAKKTRDLEGEDSTNGSSAVLKERKRAEFSRRFYELNLLELKEDVNRKVEEFLRNKKAKMTQVLRTNLEKYQKLKQSGDPRETLELKIDRYFNGKPDVYEDLRLLTLQIASFNRSGLEKLGENRGLEPLGAEDEAFLQRMLLGFDQKYADFDSFQTVLLLEYLSKSRRFRNFRLETKVLAVLRRFMQKNSRKVLQKGLNEDLSSQNKSGDGLEAWKGETRRGKSVGEGDKGRKKEGIEEKIARISRKREVISRIREKRAEIQQIPEKFNFWAYKNKQNRLDFT